MGLANVEAKEDRMTFQAVDTRDGRIYPIYSVHRSGPQNHQTKFLVFRNGWRWEWSTSYLPYDETFAGDGQDDEVERWRRERRVA